MVTARQSSGFDILISIIQKGQESFDNRRFLLCCMDLLEIRRECDDMAQINVSNLTFCYEGSYDNIFENVSFQVDTAWKLGMIGRNGKGKTTFLNLLRGKYEYTGNIQSPLMFDYFPFSIKEEWKELHAIEWIEQIYPDYELWKICIELDLLKLDADSLYRKWNTLSYGERTKLMLAVLFSKESSFLLIDEPTNHLDIYARELVKKYLNRKSGFILVSHDRNLMDGCVDHVLVLERNQIIVERGNFSSWWENKQKRDLFEQAENDRLKKDIKKLQKAARQAGQWADRVESTKIGFNPVKEHDRSISTRAYIGEKSRRMQQRRKNLEHRQQSAIEQKEGMLKNIENPAELRMTPLSHHKDVLIRTENVGIFYGEKEVVKNLNLELRQGERLLLSGGNGCGKSSVINAILGLDQVEILGNPIPGKVETTGTLEIPKGLKISYISQDTSFLKGRLEEYIDRMKLSETLFKSILRQLDFDRVQFDKNMEEYSEGQKKKVLIAGSLLSQAHLYVWDEPLNYIDLFTRMQLEQLILKVQPTMLLVEHDMAFGQKCATKILKIG